MCGVTGDSHAAPRQHEELEMALTIGTGIPKSGRAFTVRNVKTGAAYQASYDYQIHKYVLEPLGLAAIICKPLELDELAPKFEPAGTATLTL
jgi:hypothetical protein